MFFRLSLSRPPAHHLLQSGVFHLKENKQVDNAGTPKSLDCKTRLVWILDFQRIAGFLLLITSPHTPHPHQKKIEKKMIFFNFTFFSWVGREGRGAGGILLEDHNDNLISKYLHKKIKIIEINSKRSVVVFRDSFL